MDNMRRDMQEQETMNKQGKDTSPFVTSRRITRHIRIQQVNNPPSPHLFDVTVEYLSTDLPEWFAGLQSIVEDETFTSMDINLGNGKTRYLITIAGDIESEHTEDIAHQQADIDREYRIALREGGYYACFPESEHS